MVKGGGNKYPSITIEEIKHASGDIDWFTVEGLAKFELGDKQDLQQKKWRLYWEMKKYPERFMLRTLDGSAITIVARIKTYTPKKKKKSPAEHIPPPMRKFVGRDE